MLYSVESRTHRAYDISRYYALAVIRGIERYGLSVAYRTIEIRPPEVQEIGKTTKIAEFNLREFLISDRFGKFHILAVDLTESKVAIMPTIEGREVNCGKAHGLFPLGPVRGRFRGGDPDETRFIFFTNDGRKSMGGAQIIDRFPGLDEGINDQFSGGLIIDDGGAIRIGDKRELSEAMRKSKPIAQLFYSWWSESADGLMELRWHHHSVAQRIGGSIHGWSWYLQANDKIFFLSPKSLGIKNYYFPLEYVNMINNTLVQGGQWKTSLADSGFGGGFVLNDGGIKYSNTREIDVFHTVPACLVAKSP